MTPLSPEQLAEREDAASRAFLEPQETTIGPITLRPISITSLFQLRRTKNEFLDPRGPVTELPHPQTGVLTKTRTMEDELWAMMAFAYLHAAPEREVDQAVFSPGLFEQRVQAFMRALGPERTGYIIEEITRRLGEISKLEFAVKKKPSEKPGSGPSPPPN